MDEKTDYLLNELYLNTKSSVAFTSPLALYRVAKRKIPSLTLAEVKTWLQQNDTYTLHRPVSYRFKRNPVLVDGIDDQWQADLVDISSIARFNKGFRYLLTCIDVFSKFAWVVPLRDKTGNTLVTAFQSILNLGRRPQKLQTDKGTEFLNSSFQQLLKRKRIHFFTTNSEMKASIVERFNRSLKTRMWKYFTANNTHVYLDVLQDLVSAYNNSYHRSIGREPISVNLLNVGQVRRKLYGNLWRIPSKKFKFKIGDQVRISKSRRTFKKGYLPNWTEEIFTISKIIPRSPLVYGIKDYHGEELQGVFYAEELQKVRKTDDVYRVEKVMARKTVNGKVKVLVKWQGYPNKFNRIFKSDLKNL